MFRCIFRSFLDSNTLRRLSVRLILIGFGMFFICSTMCVTQNSSILICCCGIFSIIIEGSLSFYYQSRDQWKGLKWFSPSIILFILTCIPIFKILKQHQLHVSRTFKQTNIETLLKRPINYCFNVDFHWKTIQYNQIRYPIYTFKCSKNQLASFNEENFKLMCSLLTNIQSRSCPFDGTCKKTSNSLFTQSLMKTPCTHWRNLLNRLTLIGILSDELAGFMLIEQLFLLILVLVNWIWPQTESSEEIYFAQMLRQYLAAAPDIVEFYGNFYEGENLNQLQDHEHLQMAIFITFILSTFQFSLNLQMKIKPTIDLHEKNFSQLNLKHQFQLVYEFLFCTSMWSVIYLTLTQDLPFLIIRWYFLAFMSDSSSKMLFFLLKNVLTIIISFHSGFNDILEFQEKLQRKICSKNR